MRALLRNKAVNARPQSKIAAEFMAKAEDAKRRAEASKTEKEKLVNLRRKEDFEKLARGQEKK